MLNEDPSERADFDAQVKAIYEGDPLLAVQSMLTTWSRVSPQYGGYAKILAICANEVEKARIAALEQKAAGLRAAREATLDAVLRGLRSENDSTQLRAIIANVEEMRSATG